MRVVEIEAKRALQAQFTGGLAFPRSYLVRNSYELAPALQVLGGRGVIKAQLPLSGRMKAGLVQFSQTTGEGMELADKLWRQKPQGLSIAWLSVEEIIPIAGEFLVACTYDAAAGRPAILVTSAGGIQVEEHREEIVRRDFSPQNGLPPYAGREMAAAIGLQGSSLVTLGHILSTLSQTFLAWDATLLEINPLALAPNGRFYCLDVHLELDDEALYRQSALLERFAISQSGGREISAFEQRAAEIDATDHRGVAGRLVPFPGTLGLLIGGGGASLTIFDAIQDAGITPANYCEIGGNPSVWKVKELTKLILSQPGVAHLAVIMNVVSNTRADLVARGVIKGVLELERDPAQTILAFRIPGSWDEEAALILDHYRVAHFGREVPLDQVVAHLSQPRPNQSVQA